MASGVAPADVFLNQLFDDGEYQKLADVAIRFEEFARTGTLDVSLQLNDLGHDIWEIKAVAVRLPLYYVESHGGVRAARITSGFLKKGRLCPPRQIRLAMRVRGEDAQL